MRLRWRALRGRQAEREREREREREKKREREREGALGLFLSLLAPCLTPGEPLVFELCLRDEDQIRMIRWQKRRESHIGVIRKSGRRGGRRGAAARIGIKRRAVGRLGNSKGGDRLSCGA